GHQVEVFTTCTKSESDWRNELPPGTTTDDGLVVHRFPIDAHNREAHLESLRTILEASGHVTSEAEDQYLRHSVHSTALLDALRQREQEFAAIITGPYLFGLTYDVAQAFADRTLVVPCFHDEPIARLPVWPSVYGAVGGLLLHSPEEKELMRRLGVNHPTAVEVGTCIEAERAKPQAV